MARPCPLCENELLRPLRVSHVEVDTCPRCHGLWFDRGELERFPDRPSARSFLAMKGQTFSRCRKSGHPVGRAEAMCPTCRSEPVRCPACSERLRRVVTSASPVDVCPSCEGVWLDAGAFEALGGVTVISQPKTRPAPAAAMECSRCGVGLKVSEAYVYDGDVYCGACRPPGAVSGAALKKGAQGGPLRRVLGALSTLSLAASLVATGCAHTPSPSNVAKSYAQALEENRLADAYALTNAPPEAQPGFLEHYADASVRQARVKEVRAALPELQARAPALTLLQVKDGWRVVEEKPEDAPRAVLKRFLDAVGASNWATAWSLLSDPLRARYTPERLREDFKREPQSAERVRRAQLALKGGVRVTASGAEFPIGKGRAVRLVREAGEYRVAAIE
ncbi:zf-TFIIB domain-containing protein [Archangium lansingense]|uniref:Zf-TFIIB domain-containing protein n=1 Tax=Archangium lansingense TaxID=2995310 RepID=A0ABT4A961_9BACT|nr:zf-TFIIB domain-containing protein [Archangium lansinium]MCY1078195.1 zf-TFIIB domain-containing protein [Archangium lansinium]